MRKVIYYVACTVDRFIAREDGSFDCFLAEGEHLADLFRTFPDTVPGHMRDSLGITEGNRLFDTVLMGRKTYEVGLDIGVTSPYPHLRQYVFSQSMKGLPDPGLELVSSNPLETVRKLKAESGLDIWLCGGGQLASLIFTEIDELILKVNPVLIGTGIPLFSRPIPKTDLSLSETRTYNNGVAIMRYQVISQKQDEHGFD